MCFLYFICSIIIYYIKYKYLFIPHANNLMFPSTFFLFAFLFAESLITFSQKIAK